MSAGPQRSLAGAAATTANLISGAGSAAVTSRLPQGQWGQPRAAERQWRCPMLEPDALQGARPVLRGGGAGNSSSLPDPWRRRLAPAPEATGEPPVPRQSSGVRAAHFSAVDSAL